MSKTDDFIKSELDSIQTNNLKRRFFLGTSYQDQKLWSEGGLTFGIGGFKYGSLDFAWYKNKDWTDPYTNNIIDKKPIVVVEGSDCLNTRSWGNAQIQRFHHLYGAFLSNLCAVYYLRKGEHPVRPELYGITSHLNNKYRNKSRLASLLIITDLDELNGLIKIIDKHGAPSVEYDNKVREINDKMNHKFNEFFNKFSGWSEYLESRAIVKSHTGEYLKYLGPRKKSLIDSSQRMGHIILGEAILSSILLDRSNSLNEFFYYFFPLLTKQEIKDIDSKLTNDKEWNLLRKSNNSWRIITLDCLSGVEEHIIDKISTVFRKVNLNYHKKEWSDCKKYIAKKIHDGDYKIVDYIKPMDISTTTQQRIQ